MSLDYLIFDRSEDTEGIGTFEAMASVSPGHLAAVRAEVDVVLAWAFEAFPGEHGDLEEGCAWSHDLQEQEESATLHTVTLLLSGRAAFCQAFADRFTLD